MGQLASKVRGAVLTRPLQRFNIESRTERLLERDAQVPRAAPKFPSDEALLKKIRESNPEIAEAASKKDQLLHKRLEKVLLFFRAFLSSFS